jgi:hypothetical protein
MLRYLRPMSRGPGRVERAIRDMIEREQARQSAEEASLRFPSAAVYGAAFVPPWSRAQQVSAQRAMYRVMAGETGWRTEGGKRRRTVFCFERPDGAQAETPTQSASPLSGPQRASTPVQPDLGAPLARIQPSLPVEPPEQGVAEACAQATPETTALPMVGVPDGALPKSATTVTIASKLPMGLVLRVQETFFRRVAGPRGFVTEQAARDVGPTFVIRGVAHPPNQMPQAVMAGGYALTPGIPIAFWQRWVEQNRDSAVVRNRMVFAHGTDTGGMAREHRDLRSGLEPLHRDSSGELDDPRVLQPINPLIGAVETSERP